MMQTLKPRSPHLELPRSAPCNDTTSTTEIDFSPRWRATIGTFRNERTDVANPKPNEDRAAVDPGSGSIIVADGITRTKRSDNTYPDPSPSAQLAELLCENLPALRGTSPAPLTQASLQRIVADANRLVARFNQHIFPSFDFAERDRAGVAAALGVIQEKDGGEELLAASIADTIGVIFRNGIPELVAREKTSQSREEYKRLSEIRAREFLRNKLDNPFAYGALTGEPEALHFVEYNRVSLENVERIAFFTDGLLRVLEQESTTLATHSASQIIDRARDLDRRHGETDDKTIVILDRVYP